MRKFISSLLILLSVPTLAQEHNFIIENSDVIFRKVFEIDVSSDMVIKHLNAIGAKNINKQKDYLTFEIDGIEIDYQKYGTSRGSLPIGVVAPFYANGLIEFKEGKYRGSISKIVWKDRYTEVSGYDMLTKKRGTMFRDSDSMKKVIRIYNQYFEDLMTIKSTDDDW